MKYELILFDADGTLFDYDRAEYYALEKSFAAVNLPFHKNILTSYKIINSTLWLEFEKGFISPGIIRVERFKQLFDKVQIKTNIEDFGNIYLDFFAEAGFLIDDSEKTVRKISSMAKIAIITNGLSAVQRSRFSHSSIMSEFQHVIISEETGTAKPDPKIFEITFDKVSHSNKKTTLIVGDSLTSDIQGGINFGIDTCWFNPEKTENKLNISPTYEIANLNELVNIVSGGANETLSDV